jgi:uncharacterized protein YbjT (DUF2867 family)
MKIAIIGATGMLGAPVVEQLKSDKFELRICSRNPDTAKLKFWDDSEYVKADVTDIQSLARAFVGCQAVHLNLNTERGAEPDEVLWRGLENVGKAARAARLEKVSIITGDWMPDPEHAWPRRRAFSRGILALEQCGIPVITWGATWFFESLDYFVLQDRALMVGEQPLLWHWIAANDYARMVSKAMTIAFDSNKRFTVHGPEGIRMFDALKRYCAIAHPHLPVEQLSIEATKLFAQKHAHYSWLAGFADFMAIFETFGETGDPAEANKICGAATMTFEQWVKARS